MMTIEEATDFSAQPPLIIRGSYYSEWNPSKTPLRINKEEFINRVHSHLNNDPNISVEDTVRKIFHLIEKKSTLREINDVKG